MVNPIVYGVYQWKLYLIIKEHTTVSRLDCFTSGLLYIVAIVCYIAVRQTSSARYGNIAGTKGTKAIQNVKEQPQVNAVSYAKYNAA